MSMGDTFLHVSEHNVMVFSELLVVRKHSPRRWLPETPEGQFWEVSPQIYDFCVFWPFGGRIRLHSAISGEAPT